VPESFDALTVVTAWDVSEVMLLAVKRPSGDQVLAVYALKKWGGAIELPAPSGPI